LICPACGKKHRDDSDEESEDLCPSCNGFVKIECMVDCGPGGMSERDGRMIIDVLVKTLVGRGFTVKDIDFLGSYPWRNTPVKKEEMKIIKEQ